MVRNGNIYRALVTNADPATGSITVTVPSIGGVGHHISITSIGRKEVNGNWKVPDVGAVVLVGSDDVNASNLFLIPTYSYDETLWVDELHANLQGTIVFIARNDSASTISSTKLVCGRADGSDLVIDIANGNDVSKPAIGFAIDDIPPNGYGRVAVAGVIYPINTSTLSANIDIFCGINGGVVSTPIGVTYPQVVGKVLKVGTQGSVLITIENLSTEIVSSGSFSGVFAGTIYAAAGNIGGASSGWIIDSDRLESRGTTKKIVMDGTDGEIYIGTFGTGTYNGASTPFYVNQDGYFSLGNKLTFNPTTSTLDINGKITAASGNIGGWNIGVDRLNSGTGSSTVGLSTGGSVSIYAGGSNENTAPFRVTNTGYLTATGVDLNGRFVATSGSVGGWAIDSGKLWSTGATGTQIVLDSSNGKMYVGNENWANTGNRFYVDNVGKFSLGSKLTWDGSLLLIDGTITAASGTIGGWSIDNTKLYAGTGSNFIALSSDNAIEYRTWAGSPTPASAPFYITKAGGLLANNASITGRVVATSGSFSGSITAASISGSTITGGSISGTSVSGVSITGSTVTAGSISGNTITGGSISGALVTAGSISGNTITGGSISGAIVTAGSISGSTISGNTITGGTISGASLTAASISGGQIAIGSNFSVTNSGVLTASGASINGAINATSGTFSGSITAASISGSTITGGSISGTSVSGVSITGSTVTAGSISGNTITGGSISGALVTAGSISGNSITGSSISGTTITAGSISGNAISGGSITGASLTAASISGGQISIGSNFTVSNTGVITASGASINGVINATSGTFSGTITAASISGSTITGGSISGNTITGGSISGSTITGGSINGNTITGGSISGALVTAGSISGNSITGSTITGGSITGNTISGGTISGSQVTGASLSGGQITIGSGFSVNNAGVLTASGASIQGNINATSGSFSGTISATSGSIGGWSLGANEIFRDTSGSASTYRTGLYASTGSSSNPSKFYMVKNDGIALSSPAHASSTTPFYVDSNGRFSIADKIFFDPSDSQSFGTLTVIGRIRGAIENTPIVPTDSGQFTVTAASISGTSPNQTAVITTSTTHTFAVGDTVIIESLTTGASPCNGAWAISEKTTTTFTITGVSGATTGNYTGQSGIARVRELTLGLHPAFNGSPAGLGIRLDEYNYWFVNNQYRVGSSGSFFKWDGATLEVSGKVSAQSGNFSGFMTINNGTMKIGANANGASHGFYIGTSGDYLYDSGAFRFGGASGIAYSGSGNVTVGTGVVVNGNISGATGTFSGSLNATSGSIGGWLIGGTSLTSGTGSSSVGVASSGGFPFYAGSTTASVAPFRVTSTGGLTATGASIVGTINATNSTFTGSVTAASITGSSISGTSITAGSISGNTITGGTISGTSITAGSISGTYITGGSVNGTSVTAASISGGQIAIGSNFNVTNSGVLTASGASINGAINASSGTFTGTITAASITGGSINGSYITAGSINGTSITGTSITGASLSGGQIGIGSNFNVTNAGVLTASGASINGAINASSGTFTGTITAASITGGSINGTSITAGSINGAYITAGSINGTSVTGASLSGGQITIGSNFNVTNAGVLTASGASINGAINASSGTFTGTITAASITGGSINGAYITAGSINAARITGGSISGALVTAGSISGNTITGSSISGTTITAGSISGNTITGGSISGAVITAGSINGNTITGGVITGSSVSGVSVTGASVTGAYVSGGSVDIGTNPSVSFHIDSLGNVWTGASTGTVARDSAPFRLYNDGSIDIGGNDSTSLHINALGNVYAGAPKTDPSQAPSAIPISSITGLSGSQITITTSSAHGFLVGHKVTGSLITSNPVNSLNFVDFTVTGASTTAFTVANPTSASVIAALQIPFTTTVLYQTAAPHNFRTGASVVVSGITGGSAGSYSGTFVIQSIDTVDTFLVNNPVTGAPTLSSARAVMSTTYTSSTGLVRRIPPLHITASDGSVRASYVVASDKVSGSSNHLNLNNILRLTSDITMGNQTLYATDSLSSYDEGFNFSLSAANGFNARVGTTPAIQINSSGYTSILPISTTSTVTATGTVTTSGTFTKYGGTALNSSSNTPTARWASGTAGGVLEHTTASSRRYKFDISPIGNSEVDPYLLLNIPVVKFKFNEGYLGEGDPRIDKFVPGFIAEDVFDQYPIACDLNEDGIPETWNERIILPPMLKLVQDLYTELVQVKSRLEALEAQ